MRIKGLVGPSSGKNLNRTEIIFNASLCFPLLLALLSFSIPQMQLKLSKVLLLSLSQRALQR